MAYFVKHVNGLNLFTSEKATTLKDAVVEATKQRANLRGANLRGANLRGPVRSDGYQFFLQQLKDDTEPMVKAGCRYFTITGAQEHWGRTRKGTSLFNETETIVRCLVDLARQRGYVK